MLIGEGLNLAVEVFQLVIQGELVKHLVRHGLQGQIIDICRRPERARFLTAAKLKEGSGAVVIQRTTTPC